MADDEIARTRRRMREACRALGIKPGPQCRCPYRADGSGHRASCWIFGSAGVRAETSKGVMKVQPK